MIARRLVPVLASLALVAAACGDDGDDAASETTAADTATSDAQTATSAATTATTAGEDTTVPDATTGDTAAAATDASMATDATTGDSEAPGTAGTTGGTVDGDITVFAAASLTDAFADVATAFEEANPDAGVELSFDGSSALVQQLIEGAPGDVFASADQNNMDKLTAEGLEGAEPVIFATNLLAIIVAPDNPLGITGVEDLADEDLTVVVCAEEVPCGTYANEVFANAGVTVTPDSYEQNVRGVASKVVEGEADAGIVYVTDVMAAGDDAALVEIPEDVNVVAEYPVAPLAASGEPETAAAFIEFLLGDEGQAILGEYGFSSP